MRPAGRSDASTPRQPRAVTRVVAVTAAGALASVLIATILDLRTAGLRLWALPVAFAVVFLCETPLLSRRVGGEREQVSFGEAGFVIAASLLPIGWVVPTVMLAVVASFSARRTPPVKTLFNASNYTIGAGIGGLVVCLMSGSGGSHSGSYLALAAGAAVYGVWNWFPLAAVVGAASGTNWLRILLREIGFLRFMAVLGNTALGIAVLALAQWSPVTLIVLPPVMAGLLASYRANLKNIEQRNDWRLLNAAAEEMTDLNEATIIRQAQARAREIFSAHEVDLRLDPGPAADLSSLPRAGNLPVIPERTHGLGLPSLRPERTVREKSIRLVAGNGPIGVLDLTFKGRVPWTDHEDQVLSAFAHTVSSALIHARLYSQARRQAEDKAYEASHDALTGLGNRRLLVDRAQEMLAAAEASNACVGLLLIDLDKFKVVNDSLGHSAGDRLLRGVAERLRRSVRADDVVVRLGGDEFAILLTGIDGPSQAESVAAELATVLTRPVTFEGTSLLIEGAVGVACYPEDGSNTEELLQRADIAMYQAKGSHPRWQRYRADRDNSTLDRLALVAELRPAIADGHLVVHYQPQMDLKTGRITGAEALVRWNHPVRGMLTPDTFVPAVEQSGYVQEFTRAILRQALEACAGWRADGYEVGVSVNLSARNLLNSDLPGEVAQLLLASKVPAAALTLEITETAMMTDPSGAQQLLANLAEIGVRLAVDDFGTGYSSLTLLQQCVLHEVKVDRSFVRRLLVEQNDAAIVAATVGLAHSLGLSVVAEGIENSELVTALAALQCDVGQGHYIGAAMPLTTFTSWLADNAATDRRDGGTNAQILPMHPRRPA